MTKKEFKTILQGTGYLTESGKIDYDEIFNMIILANEYHAKECESRGYKALTKEINKENNILNNRYHEINIGW